MTSPIPLKESPSHDLHVTHIRTLRQACALESVAELFLIRAGQAVPSDALVQCVSFIASQETLIGCQGGGPLEWENRLLKEFLTELFSAY